MISIIIPVFNSEKTIENTLESIRKQSYKDYEVILVDDGSTDKTASIIKKYAEVNSLLIKYIYENNAGPGSARNMGLNKADGDYICFVDSDDILFPNYLQILFDNINSSNVDLCVGNYHKIIDSKSQVDMKSKLKGKVTSETAIVSFLKNESNISLWNSIFKKEIIKRNGVCFKENCYNGEDVYFILTYLSYSKTVFFLRDFIYTFEYNSERARVRSSKCSVCSVDEILYFPLQKIFETNHLYKANSCLIYGKIPLVACHELLKKINQIDDNCNVKDVIINECPSFLYSMKKSKSRYMKIKAFIKLKLVYYSIFINKQMVYKTIKKRFMNFY